MSGTATLHAAGELGPRVVRAVAERFGGAPTLVARAPGRVNLIGDHTDYNGGFVLPMAMDRATWIAARARGDRRVVVHSLDFEETRDFVLDDTVDGATRPDGTHERGWLEYLRGIGWSLAEAGHALVRGWEGVCAGDVPIGAGLSSSASLELVVARVFAEVNALSWNARAMALIAQRAERGWVGVDCGIMDQLIAAAGVAGHALLIDCRSLETRAVPLPEEAAVVVLDTATRRALVGSAYNERRAQCEAAAAHFGVATLREVPRAAFDAGADALDPLTRRRARHVVSESERTVASADALSRGDLACVGRSMNESHASLRDDFEVSCRELDAMVALAQAHPACIGARMTGAGFGGCAVALVQRGAVSSFVDAVSEAYREKTGLAPSLYVCRANQGASLEG